MNIIADSWTVLVRDAGLVLGILCALLLAAGMLFFLFRAFFSEYISLSECLVLSLAGAPFPLLTAIGLLSFLSFLLKFRLDFLFFPLLVLSCALAFIFTRRKTIPKQEKSASVLALAAVWIVTIYIRLAFLSKLIVPPYFDSAQHALIITNLITAYEAFKIPSFDALAGGYYHLGYHVLLAAFSLAFHVPVKEAMLVFGQILLACIPLPLFFFVKHETRSDLPALVAVLFAGCGWSLPAHAVNWGKYPALAGILAFMFTAGIILWLPRARSKRHQWMLGALCLLSVGLSTFIHSRVLILVVIVVLCGLTAARWQRLPRNLRALAFLLATGLLAGLTAVIRTEPMLGLLFDPYIQSGLWISLAVLLLFPFACRSFPQASFACLLALLLLLGSLLVPIVNLLPGRTYQTLLDRPFVEMVLFFPLSFLAGLGLAGLSNTLSAQGLRRALPPKWLPAALAILLVGLVFANALARYDVYPSACCQIFAADDAVAFDWMDRNLPQNARILIASSDMLVFETGSPASPAGSDAGVWLKPLIDRNTFSMPTPTDFPQPSLHEMLLQLGIAYVYIGGTPQSFSVAPLEQNRSFYKPVFTLPGAHVYQVLNTP